MPAPDLLAPLTATFCIIFLAELPDKTALTALTLATQGRPLQVWLGASIGFLGQAALAVAAGTLISGIPAPLVRWLSGLGFLAFAVLMWRRGDGGEAAAANAQSPHTTAALDTVVRAAVLIFLAEFGDLTQLATADLTLRLHDPVAVFVGAWLGLCAVAFLAVVVGSRLGCLLQPRRLRFVASGVLALLGIAMLLGLGQGII